MASKRARSSNLLRFEVGDLGERAAGAGRGAQHRPLAAIDGPGGQLAGVVDAQHLREPGSCGAGAGPWRDGPAWRVSAVTAPPPASFGRRGAPRRFRLRPTSATEDEAVPAGHGEAEEDPGRLVTQAGALVAAPESGACRSAALKPRRALEQVAEAGHQCHSAPAWKAAR